jgi:hypothetical protein
MSLSRNSIKAAVVLAGLASLGGCADYLNHWDTVSFASGDAVEANAAIHTVDPQAHRAEQTHIATDGRYVNNVMNIYRQRPTVTEITAETGTGIDLN